MIRLPKHMIEIFSTSVLFTIFLNMDQLRSQMKLGTLIISHVLKPEPILVKYIL